MSITDIKWRLVSPAELPADYNWLSNVENIHLQRLIFPKRRSEWLLGRWAAKKLLSSHLPDLSDQDMRYLSIENEVSGAPFATWRGERLPGCLSLSHRADLAAAAWFPIEGVRVGIDLELIETKSVAFINDYFTADEAACVFALPSAEQPLAASLVWSAKEALLKAMQTGLRIDTRQVEVAFIDLIINESWHPLQIVHCPSSAETQTLFWLFQPPYIITLAMLSDVSR